MNRQNRPSSSRCARALAALGPVALLLLASARAEAAPAAPQPTSIAAGATPELQVFVPAAGTVRFWRNASCSAPAGLPNLTAPTAPWNYQVALPLNQAPMTLYANVTNASGTSACSPYGVPYYPVRALECPSLPPEASITRPPSYIEYTAGDLFCRWASNTPGQGCNRSVASCPPGDGQNYFADIKQDAPSLVWSMSPSIGVLPMNYEVGPIRSGVDGIHGTCATEPATSLFGPASIYLTPSELTTRIDDLAIYNQQLTALSGSLFVPYYEFGTAIRGSAHNRTGIWGFHDVAGALGYAPGGAYALPSEPGSGGPLDAAHPRDWLAATWDPNWSQYPCSGSCPGPEDRQGLAFLYPQSTTNDESRFTADYRNAGYLDWQKETQRQMALAGYKTIYLDNTVRHECHNDDCEAEFHSWFASNWSQHAGSASPARTPTSTAFLPGTFEAWPNASASPPFDPTASTPIWPSAPTVLVEPDIDAAEGFYSARFTPVNGPARYWQGNYLSGVPTTFQVSLMYKTLDGATSTLSIIDSAYNQLASIALTPSTSWRSVTSLVATGTPYAIVIDLHGAVKLDDLYLGSPIPPAPFSNHWLWLDPALGAQPASNSDARSEDSSWGNAFTSGFARKYLSFQYADWGVDQALAYMKPAGVGYFLNSGGVQRAGADWFSYEGSPIEYVKAQPEVGWNPGSYPRIPANAPKPAIPTPTIVENGFQMRAATRDPSRYANLVPLELTGRDPDVAPNWKTTALHFAEKAAFGGGTGVAMDLSVYDEVAKGPLRQQIRASIGGMRANPSLFACLQPAADIGIIVRTENDYYHQYDVEAYRLYGSLAKLGYSVDVLGQTSFTQSALARFKAVVVDHTARLSPAEGAALIAYANAGGIVLTTPDSGRLDEIGRLRAAYPYDASGGTRGGFWPNLQGAALPARFRLPSVGSASDAPITVTDVTNALATLGSWSAVPVGVGALPPGAPTPALRTMKWGSFDRTIVHVLNYNVATGTTAQATPVGMPVTRVLVQPEASAPRPTKLTVYSWIDPNQMGYFTLQALPTSTTTLTCPPAGSADARCVATIPTPEVGSILVLSP